jgi:hypothetical protein
VLSGFFHLQGASASEYSLHSGSQMIQLLSSGPPYVTLKLLPLETEVLASSETTLIFLTPKEETTPEVWHTPDGCQSALQLDGHVNN